MPVCVIATYRHQAAKPNLQPIVRKVSLHQAYQMWSLRVAHVKMQVYLDEKRAIIGLISNRLIHLDFSLPLIALRH